MATVTFSYSCGPGIKITPLQEAWVREGTRTAGSGEASLSMAARPGDRLVAAGRESLILGCFAVFFAGLGVMYWWVVDKAESFRAATLFW